MLSRLPANQGGRSWTRAADSGKTVPLFLLDDALEAVAPIATLTGAERDKVRVKRTSRNLERAGWWARDGLVPLVCCRKACHKAKRRVGV